MVIQTYIIHFVYIGFVSVFSLATETVLPISVCDESAFGSIKNVQIGWRKHRINGSCLFAGELRRNNNKNYNWKN